MVLVNDKKFACATCIKGHRVSGCTHTDRPLFEVKKKGRPSTQCTYCKDKRKGGGAAGGSVHSKCNCDNPDPPEVIMPGSSRPIQPQPDDTRKGQPGANPTLPNGLKDIHDMTAAVEALSAFQKDNEMQAAQRKVANLLNPCHCKTGGICRCCGPKPKVERIDTSPSPVSHSSGSRTPNGGSISDNFIEMFKTKASTGDSEPSGLMDHLKSPDNSHHPAHTSPHVHKTRLYSPYTPSGQASPRHGRDHHHVGWANSSTRPPKVKPIANMSNFLGAVFKDDGTVAKEIPRSALGLPGIQTFDSAAERGGVKVEASEMEVDAPVSFPTQDDVVIGACTCGDDCDCPGCAIHGNAPANTATNTSQHCCGDHCSSTFDCTDHLSFPRGIRSIDQLLSIAAANVPHPPKHRRTNLDAQDTSILPPGAILNDDAARSHGVIPLKRLECCNGRCQCAPGECTCEQDCCGCCVRCACDETPKPGCGEPPEKSDKSEKSCCVTIVSEGSEGQSCCSTTSVPIISAPIPPDQPLSIVAPTPERTLPDSSLLSPDSAMQRSSPTFGTSVEADSSPLQRRRSSSASKNGKASPRLGRRATVGSQSTGTNSPVHRSASTGKQASKSLALHQQPNHPNSHGGPHKQHNPPIHPGGPPVNAGHRRPGSISSGQRTPSSERRRHTPSNSEPNILLPQSQPRQPQSSGFSLENFSNDNELMAYINSLTGNAPPPPSSDMSSGPYSASTGSSGMFNQVNPFDAMQPQVQPQQQQQQQQQPPPPSGSAQDSGMSEQEMLETIAAMMNQQIATQNPTDAFQAAYDPNPNYLPPGNLNGYTVPPVNDAMGMPTTYAELVMPPDVRNTASASGPPPTDARISQVLPPQSAAFIQGLLQNPTETGNPNLIDLSKPLTANDVERILRALQSQNDSTTGQQQQQQQQQQHQTQQSRSDSTLQQAPGSSGSTSGRSSFGEAGSLWNLTANYMPNQHDPNKQSTGSISNINIPTLPNGNNNGNSLNPSPISTSSLNPNPSLIDGGNGSGDGQRGMDHNGNGKESADMDDLFSKFVFDPNLLRDANGDLDLDMDLSNLSNMSGGGISNTTTGTTGFGTESASAGHVNRTANHPTQSNDPNLNTSGEIPFQFLTAPYTYDMGNTSSSGPNSRDGSRHPSLSGQNNINPAAS